MLYINSLAEQTKAFIFHLLHTAFFLAHTSNTMKILMQRFLQTWFLRMCRISSSGSRWLDIQPFFNIQYQLQIHQKNKYLNLIF